MKIAAAFIYWVIVAVWLAVLTVVLVSYFRRVRTFGTTRMLLAVVAIDTFRNIVENTYFGLYFDAQYGFLPDALIAALGKPILLIIPKLLNVASGCIVMSILLLRWLPEAVIERNLLEQQKAIVEAEVQKRTLALEEALAGKTLLLHEVDHRVKNNLTMIGSLLRLQSRQIGDRTVSSKLDAMLERVDALATVHRRLYQSDDVTRFDLGAFARTLVQDVIGASGRTNLMVETDVERLEVPSNKAAALGLVINELVTNAVKHAFAGGRAGTLRVSAAAIGGYGKICIADDGRGMAREPELTDGLGRSLVTRLSKQVGATAAWEDARPGTRVTISFPLEATS